MKKRITAIVGAGAVIDFDYNNNQIKPLTSNITNELVKICIEDENNNQCELVKKVYDMLDRDLKKMNDLCRKNNSNHVSINEAINFEVLFYAIESLYTYSKGWQNERYPFDRYPYPWLASLVKTPLEYDREDYHNALMECTKRIIQIVDSYDNRFQNDETSEDWYRCFWLSFGNAIDVFTFNYDNTIENSVVKYNDGFVELQKGVNHRVKRFEPEVLWYNKRSLPTICHLHGNIRYGLVDNPEFRPYYGYWDLYKYHDVDYEGLQNRMVFRFPTNQAREDTVCCPIITGLRKTDKLCYMPSNFYHAFFSQRMLRNPSILIVGISFGDLYANQLIERHRLIYPNKQRIVMIDYWSLEKKNDLTVLYEYVENHTSTGFRSFLFHLLCNGKWNLLPESGTDLMKRLFVNNMEWREHYWTLKDGRLRIYIDGFKKAVESYQDEIISYLKSNE